MIRGWQFIIVSFIALTLLGCAASTSQTENSSRSTKAFVHPGVLTNRAQLELIKSQIGSGLRKEAFEALQRTRRASLNYEPQPRAVVECGAYSRPNFGCTNEREDALAAYTHALLWYLTEERAHAEKSIEIMKAWAETLSGGHIGHNARLQAGWAGTVWPMAGELIRHTYDGWSEPDMQQFILMLKTQYQPSITESATCTNGNWELIMIEAMINIAVFVEDRALFDHAIERWRARVPAYIYLETDGPLPIPPPDCEKTMTDVGLIRYWHGQTTFVDGLAQETCRDFGHVLWGIGAGINAAETAFQQGVDLYAEESKRFIATLEFHAKYLLGEPVPDWLCGGDLNRGGKIPMWEIGYNHFHNRLGHALPLTEKYLNREGIRPTGVNYFLAWETLTHAETGWAGISAQNP